MWEYYDGTTQQRKRKCESMDWKKVLVQWRIIVLIFFLLGSLLLIQPALQDGVAIRSIAKESPASLAGMHAPLAKDKPMFREVITAINGISVGTVEDYNEILSAFTDGDVVRIETKTKYTYEATGRKLHFFKTEMVYTAYYNSTTGLGIEVYDAPSTNIKKGLDLQGGTRVLLQPETPLSAEDLATVIETLQQRLNVYGLSDLVITSAYDLHGNQFILIEIAAVTEEEMRTLLETQGSFEARIGNETVFRGGEDIVYVCRSPECSFVVDPQRPCQGTADAGYICSFSFAITLTPEAAARQAAITATMPISPEGPYLAEPLDLYLDNVLVDSLRIGADLKGRAVTDIAISGPGIGASYDEAVQNSAQNMKQLQTLLITGSLPTKLSIVKIDTISPAVGEEFVKNILLVVLYAILAVGVVLGIRYRNVAIVTLIMATMLAEIVIILGIAAFIGWNIDIAAVAGILVAVGTGVDAQIVITDEAYNKKKEAMVRSWKEKLKRAFVIIMAAYLTTVVAMIPLFWAGAGALKGFALTSILGVTIGVFITRPAYAIAVENILKEGEE